MKSPGQQLKSAREQLGKTQSEMAKKTRISIQQLQGLEDDRYESIPAPMYVRGFIKLYAKELGLNPDPLVARYEQLRSGEPMEEIPPAVPAPAVSVPSPTSASTLPLQQRVHPEFMGEEALTASPPKRPAFDWKRWRQKLPRLQDWVDPQWFSEPRVRYASAGIGVLIALLLLRSCVKSNESAPLTPPEVAEPLLNPPDPVYFQLPSSYQ